MNHRKFSNSSIDVFCALIQKAGFMLLEVAFARNPKERRYVIVLVSDANNQDVKTVWE